MLFLVPRNFPSFFATQGAVVLALLLFLIVGSTAYYRVSYAEAKRLRIVEPGKLYRSGQLSQRGLERTLRRFGIRTVINLQEEAPNPELGAESEVALCRRLAVRYVFLPCDSLSREQYQAGDWPESARLFLALATDPASQPVLIHCRAGLHRTGVLCAIYRVCAQGWSTEAAWAELCAHGYGDDRCSGLSYTFRDYLLPLWRTPYVELEPRATYRSQSRSCLSGNSKGEAPCWSSLDAKALRDYHYLP
ncbi:MAG: tyrosine-protein phosphatase [Gemmatales bacterium]|nr:tyrosine-protein phosphatase [Gemmatales bacterium]MCS7160474.1 tyrosine-protein phosphatase [Gemmatales bacterium]MDW8175674.1 tyrosine-protein phosphatase [Gemmatales bacterium]MDW8222469.1 tyrosine-protein phosphatase [Gemmatales bacterium]